MARFSMLVCGWTRSHCGESRVFSPKFAENDMDALIEERPIGGLRLHLVRSLAQSIEYCHERDRNVLTVTVGPG